MNTAHGKSQTKNPIGETSKSVLSVRVAGHLKDLAPYQAGKPIGELAREIGIDEVEIVKLASNENPLGMSPKARKAADSALSEAWRYPDADGYELKRAIGQFTGVPSGRIVLGNGSNDLLELVARAVLGPGSSAVYDEHSFIIYRQVTALVGADGIAVQSRNFSHDLERMAESVTRSTQIVFVANPNNPTGTFHPEAALRAFLEKIPCHVLVVLDEAYTDYLPSEDQVNSIALTQSYSNLLVLRTFSKAYGLAGLRIGYGIGHPDLIGLFDHVRQPFAVNAVAQAGAIAALADIEFLARTRETNHAGRQQLADGMRKLGVAPLPSSGNFIAAHIPNALVVYEKLLGKGVIVRPLAAYGMKEWLRVSVGLPQENERFLLALSQVLAE